MSDSVNQRSLLYFFYARYALNVADGLRAYLWCIRSLEVLPHGHEDAVAKQLLNNMRDSIDNALGLSGADIDVRSLRSIAYENIQRVLDCLAD